MKKMVLISAILNLIINNYIYTQWVQISSIGNNELRSVKFLNDLTGIVVGQGGIWRSTNSGLNWTQVLSGQNMNSMSFLDNNNGYAVGDSGKVFRTTNGGQNWIQQISNTLNNLNSVSFYNNNTGFTVGQNGIILKTISAGTNWYQNVNQLSQDLNCVQMIIDGSTAIALGSNTGEYFTSTANGGANWIYSLMIPNNSLNSLNYITGLNGYIVCVGGNGRIRRSTNYGSSWTLISAGATERLNSVQFINSLTGTITGNNGIILVSTNSGINWTTQFSPTSNNLNGMSFINVTTGWIVGSNGTVLRTGIPVGIPGNENEYPQQFKLYQNYPNPFNPITKIKFELDKNIYVLLSVYDILGRLVQTIIGRNLSKGSHEVEWDATNYPSGIYIIYIDVGNKIYSKKMVLSK